MNSKEAGVLVSTDNEALFHHLPESRAFGFLSDSADLWNVIWLNRAKVAGFAHSHPGSGQPGPSWEDLTTFAAVEVGLGKRLVWWITSKDQAIALTWKGPDKYNYMAVPFLEQPDWLVQLRENSHY